MFRNNEPEDEMAIVAAASSEESLTEISTNPSSIPPQNSPAIYCGLAQRDEISQGIYLNYLQKKIKIDLHNMHFHHHLCYCSNTTNQLELRFNYQNLIAI